MQACIERDLYARIARRSRERAGHARAPRMCPARLPASIASAHHPHLDTTTLSPSTTTHLFRTARSLLVSTILHLVGSGTHRYHSLFCWRHSIQRVQPCTEQAPSHRVTRCCRLDRNVRILHTHHSSDAQPRTIAAIVTTASQNDNLNLLEDNIEVVAYLTQLVRICFEHRNVAEPILSRFCSLVVEVLITRHIDEVFSGDEDTLRRIISSFTAPSRAGDEDIGVVVCHWDPLTPKERGTLKKLRGNKRKRKHKRKSALPPSDDFDHLALFEEPLEFRRTFDRPQFSMDILGKIVPDSAKCRVVDIYTQRQPITGPDGERLKGTEPYAHDDHLPTHHAHCKSQLEDCKGKWVLLAGLDAKAWFEALYGKVKRQGQKVVIAGRERRIYFIDHMEYIGIYAKDNRLEALRKVLREMQTFGINISDEFIDERIADRAAKRRQLTVISLDSDDDDDDNNSQNGNIQTPEDFEGHDRIRVDLNAVQKSQRLSNAMKAKWQDPAFREHMTNKLSNAMKAKWQNPVTRAKFLAGIRAPEAVQRRSIISAANWENPEYRDKTMASLHANWQNPEFRERIAATKQTPEARQKRSVISTAKWQDDEYREKTVTAIQAGSRAPEERKRRSDVHLAKWQEPEFREKMSATMSVVRQAPEARQAQSDVMNALWANEEFREKQLASNRAQGTDPERRQKMVVSTLASWQGPGNEQRRQHHSDAIMFRRDDTNPTFKKQWDAKIASANKFAAARKTKTSFFNAFCILRLDPAPYNIVVPPSGFRQRSISSSPEEIIKSAFFIKAAMTGEPFFTSDEVDNIKVQLNSGKSKDDIRTVLREELVAWIRAAACIRKENIEVDYASIPHLVWMA